MIELSKIRIDGGTQPRAELNQDTVAEYAEAYKDGEKLPPVKLFFDGSAVGLRSCETKRPVIAEAVGMMMDYLLADHGRCCADLKWQKTALVRKASGMPDAKNTGDIVYFLRAGDFIKIGKATGTPDSRISQLKTGCPFPIEVAATMIGGYDEERSLHKRFAAIRAHGEWFHAAPTLLEFIGSIGAEA